MAILRGKAAEDYMARQGGRGYQLLQGAQEYMPQAIGSQNALTNILARTFLDPMARLGEGASSLFQRALSRGVGEEPGRPEAVLGGLLGQEKSQLVAENPWMEGIAKGGAGLGSFAIPGGGFFGGGLKGSLMSGGLSGAMGGFSASEQGKELESVLKSGLMGAGTSGAIYGLGKGLEKLRGVKPQQTLGSVAGELPVEQTAMYQDLIERGVDPESAFLTAERMQRAQLRGTTQVEGSLALDRTGMKGDLKDSVEEMLVSGKDPSQALEQIGKMEDVVDQGQLGLAKETFEGQLGTKPPTTLGGKVKKLGRSMKEDMLTPDVSSARGKFNTTAKARQAGSDMVDMLDEYGSKAFKAKKLPTVEDMLMELDDIKGQHGKANSLMRLQSDAKISFDKLATQIDDLPVVRQNPSVMKSKGVQDALAALYEFEPGMITPGGIERLASPEKAYDLLKNIDDQINWNRLGGGVTPPQERALKGVRKMIADELEVAVGGKYATNNEVFGTIQRFQNKGGDAAITKAAKGTTFGVDKGPIKQFFPRISNVTGGLKYKAGQMLEKLGSGQGLGSLNLPNIDMSNIPPELLNTLQQGLQAGGQYLPPVAGSVAAQGQAPQEGGGQLGQDGMQGGIPLEQGGMPPGQGGQVLGASQGLGTQGGFGGMSREQAFMTGMELTGGDLGDAMKFAEFVTGGGGGLGGGKMTGAQSDYAMATNAAQEAYNSLLSDKGVTGKIRGLVGKVEGKLGAATAKTAYATKIDTMNSFIRRAMLGSAQSESELKGLESMMPKVTDSPARAKQKFESLIPLLQGYGQAAQPMATSLGSV